MSNAITILQALDSKLLSAVDLTLYGRAALVLGFQNAPEDCMLSHDIDVVLYLGQAEELNTNTNFWQAIEDVNRELAERELYISHFFDENQVVLRANWMQERVRIPGSWRKLTLYRLSDEDLLLSKLMRDDPIDRTDARFIVSSAKFTLSDIRGILKTARIPDSPEIHE